jgi:Tol biopolymer transport system component
LSIEVYDLERGVTRRLDSKGSANGAPVWSPDGSKIAFISNQKGQYNLFLRTARGDAEDRHLLPSPNIQFPTSWSANGNVLAFIERGAAGQNHDIWLCPMGEDSQEKVRFLETKAEETQARFSPDGNWIAFVSNEENQYEVFIKRNPLGETPSYDKLKVSKQGGYEPVWAKNGKELFYRSHDGSQLLSVDVIYEPRLSAGRERIVLENLKIPPFLLLASGVDYYDVSQDAEKFLVLVEIERPETMQLVVVLNWFEELRQKMDAGH